MKSAPPESPKGQQQSAVYRALLLFGATVLAIWAFGLIFWPFRLPIAWALCLGAVTFAPYRALAERMGRPKLAAFIMVVLVLVLILGPVIGMTLLIVDEAQDVDVGPLVKTIKEAAPDTLASVTQWLRDQGVTGIPEDETVIEAAGAAAQENLPQIVRGLFTGPLGGDVLTIVIAPLQFLMGLLIALVTLYFVYCEAKRLRQFVVEVSPLEPDETDLILTSLSGTTTAALLGGVLVALLQGALGALMFWIADIPSAALWGLVMAGASLFPFGGTAIVWAPVAVYLGLTGDVGNAVFLFVFGILIVGTVDNLLRPWLMTKTGAKDVHPMLLFFAILSGIGIFGMSGIVFGPLLLALLTTMMRIYRDHFAPKARAA